jgi:hypothetical protein
MNWWHWVPSDEPVDVRRTLDALDGLFESRFAQACVFD